MKNNPTEIERYQNDTEGAWYLHKDIMKFIAKREKAKDTWDIIREKIINKFDRVVRSSDFLRKKYHSIASENNIIESIDDLKHYQTESYKKAYANFNKLINRVSYPKKKIETTKGKILLFGDNHSPFYNKKMLTYLMNYHHDAEQLFIPGDLFDCYGVSLFDKELDITLSEEIIENTLLVDMIANTWKHIRILRGNHDSNRVLKYFQRKGISPQLMFLVQHDILEMVTKAHDNIEIVGDDYEFPNGMGQATIGHFGKIGDDCLVGHFKTAKKEPVKTVLECERHMSEWESYYNVGSIRLFLQAHTHSLGKWYRKGGSLVVGETGCSCMIQGYQTTPKIGWGPNIPGYWLIYQNKGKTDLNQSNPYLYGEW
jgi:predicted phosphodiesterase